MKRDRAGDGDREAPRAGLRGRLRQRHFPPEFRIPTQAHQPPRPELPSPRVESAPQDAVPHPPDAALADLATQLWRLGKKLTEPAAEDPGGSGNGGRASSRRAPKAARHLRAAQDALAKAGVEIHDHDGMEYDIGLALDVLAYQPTPHATRETVHETVRPSVYRDGRCIQTGQVIVAQPEGEQDHGSRDR